MIQRIKNNRDKISNLGNGGTFRLSADGSKLEPVQFDTGFIVGRKTKTIRADEFNDIGEFFRIVKCFAIASDASLVGYWLDTDTGIYHIDIVERWPNIFSAAWSALENSQLALWDCANYREIRLSSIQVEEREFFGSFCRRYKFGSEHFVIVSDLVDQYGNEELVTIVDLTSDQDLCEFNREFNPKPPIDRGIIQYVNSAESQNRRESNVNGCDK